MANNKKAAVFLDRDGTIIEDLGHLHSPSEVIFYPGVVEALLRLQKYYQLFLVTNQSGVAKGVISHNDVDRVNVHIVTTLAEEGVTITDVYVCPHDRKDRCKCIKPEPYLLRRLLRITR
jgi:D-glycero-D-manno-heptose 1,7-bisphosphate phosphatase